ncbi:MAG: carbohydrate kinase family protein [Acidimicrobiales bacterium]|jgi:sugar/nucleoside kinase (ribokinase family)
MSPKRIIVLGDVMLDVIVRPVGPLAPTSDTPARVRIGRGGAGANVAVALAEGGHDVTYVGVVGDDVAGGQFVDDLLQMGVTPRLELVEGPTGVVVALIDSEGQRAMMVDRGVNGHLTLDVMLAALDEPFDHLHVSGYTLLDERTRAVATAALQVASANGAGTSVDVCSVAPLAQVTAPVFLEASAASAMLFANEEEGLLLTGADDVNGAARVLASRFDEVLITRGRDGALAAVSDTTWREPSHSAEVLDTTGAGDAASGAYLAARLNGSPVPESLTRAMQAAAAVVRGLGSQG